MTILHPSDPAASSAATVVGEPKPQGAHRAPAAPDGTRLMTAPVDATVAATAPTDPSRLRGRWPLAGFVAAAALFVMPMVGSKMFTDEVSSRGPLAVYEVIRDNGPLTHASMDLAFIGAIALALFGQGFVRFLAARTPAGSGAGTLAKIGVGAAVGLSVGIAILKGVYRGGLPDHPDHEMYTAEGMGVLHSVLDQVQYCGLWPLVFTMGAVAMLAFKHRSLPRWYGGFSGFLCAVTVLMALAPGLAYFVFVSGPVWLVASSIVVLRHRDRPVGVAV